MPTRRPSPTVVLAVGTLLLLAGCSEKSSSSTAAPPDIRGKWNMVAVANGVSFPQQLAFPTESASGAVTGTDTGTGGASTTSVFAATGTLRGNTLTLTLTLASIHYTSQSVGTIAGTGNSRTLSGTFTDSNNAHGTYTATFVPA
jgi:hypothetical protein